jgi:hypothetical protein
MVVLPIVIFPEIKLASFCVSAIAAIGIPQLTTGPQKCYTCMLVPFPIPFLQYLRCYFIVLLFVLLQFFIILLTS